MREVRQTLEHLVIIAGVFFLCVALLMAIPGIRTWTFENVPKAIARAGGTGATSGFMAGMDPGLLAIAVNDDDSRESLIELWKESLPGMEPDALADLTNQLLSDPNTAALVVDLVAELDEEAVSGLYNGLFSDPAVADFVAELLPKLDTQGLARLVNSIMASDATAALVKGLIEHTDPAATAGLINGIVGDQDGEEGNNSAAAAIVDILGALSKDDPTTDADESATLSRFLTGRHP
jgi:hypothetical protein